MINFLMKVKLEENSRLERLLAVLSLAIIVLNFVICMIILKVNKDDFTKDDIAKNEVRKEHVSVGLKKAPLGQRYQ